ncbi:MFS transporter [Mycobacterium simiae]|uniref:MFS transporter n=1 Tax=Mycobacterium simiae TaxID=1784 RepID=UPI00165EBEF4|nr:MFS transporter [Mycobacterium simiae]
MSVTTAYVAAWRHRELRRILTAWSAVMAAEWAYLTALLVIAFDHGGSMAVGLAGLARMGPAAVAAPFVAAFGDHFRRRDVLAVSAAARGFVLFVSALAILGGSGLGVLFALAAVDAAISTGIRPAQGALLPQLASDARQLAASNTLVSVMFIGGMMVGSLLGGYLCAAAAGAGVYSAAAGFFVGAAFLYARLPAGSKPRTHRRASDVWSGFRAASTKPSLAAVVGFTALQMLVRGISVPLFVLLAKDTMGSGGDNVGILLGALGAGGLLGTIVTAPLVRRGGGAGKTYGVALAGGGVFLALTPVSNLAWVVIAFIVVRGALLVAADAAGVTLIQRNADDAHRARVLGIMESLSNGMLALGSTVAPVLVMWLGLDAALVVSGLAIPVVALGSMWWFSKLDDAAADRERLVRLIAAQAAFATLGLAPLDMLAASARRRTFDPGTDIVEQGAPAMAYYAIVSGHVDVFVNGVRVASLGRGSGFGEVALLRDTTRTATVRSVSSVEVVEIDRANFVAAVAPDGPTGTALARLADLRVGTDPNRRPRPIEERPGVGDRENLRSMIGNVRGLEEASQEVVDTLVDTADLFVADGGELITRVGDRAEVIWILMQGEVEVDTASGTEQTLRSGAVIGDAAVADDCPLDTTASAAGTCRLAAIGAAAYGRALSAAH